jgi:glycosyltransferase involved in cell wall biosynthesis
MDELSAFKNPPPELAAYEELLFRRADIVFTGGRSLYEAKSSKHPNVYCFPSSIDFDHFYSARLGTPDPADQAAIPFPRVGFFGVIDERMDLHLVDSTAAAMPDVHFVMLGPTAKIDPEALPRRANIHWLGPKNYAELPRYLANWQAGWMPFALNDATRFISPTKTPEFLAAGIPLTSTDVKDVARSYGAAGVVAIAGADTMAGAIRKTLEPRPEGWQGRVDALLGETSWSRTWSAMHRHMVRTQMMRARLLASVGTLSADIDLPRVEA